MSDRRGFHPILRLLVGRAARSTPNPPASIDITTAPLLEPERVVVPTRHGEIRCLVQRPAASAGQDGLPPVVLHVHGGAFIVRHPEQDRHFSRYLADRLGAVVVLPDYDTAPGAEYPVAEEQVFDVFRWILQAGSDQGWDPARLAVSGASAGAKLAVNVCQQAVAEGAPRPAAAALVVPVVDATRWDRRSPRGGRALISPLVQKAVVTSYFADSSRRREPLASPLLDPHLAAAMPPTLIQTGDRDTLGPEGRALARTLEAGGVDVVLHEFVDADHDFAAIEPVSVVREALEEIGAFLARHLPR
jgi:acetyl esterase